MLSNPNNESVEFSESVISPSNKSIHSNKSIQSNKSIRSNYSISRSKSKYNEMYEKKKQREKNFKHRIKSNTEKYLPPSLRSPKKDENINENVNSVAKVKSYSIALKSPNDNKEKNVIPNGSPKYKDVQIYALKEASKLHTSSEREFRLKQIVGAVPQQINENVTFYNGTLQIYETDTFSFESRTQCMIITAIFIVSFMVAFVAILAVMGYSG